MILWLDLKKFSIFFSCAFPIVPDAYVEKIEVNPLDPFSVIVTWVGAPLSSMNGVPNGYNISYYRGNIYQNFLIVSFSTRNLILENLVPASLYVVSICAFNKIGLGPSQQKSFKTLNAGEFYINYIIYMAFF